MLKLGWFLLNKVYVFWGVLKLGWIILGMVFWGSAEIRFISVGYGVLGEY